MTLNCRIAVGHLNETLATDTGAERFRLLMQQGASSREIASELTEGCDPLAAEVIRSEFEALPRSFMSTWLIAWRMADESGQSFEMISEPAPRPLEYAKAGRVAYRIEHDDEGVRMYVSHVHGHHADWFKPAAEVAETAAVV